MPFEAKLTIVFPNKVSFFTISGSIITTPPIASPPYCKAEAPLITVMINLMRVFMELQFINLITQHL